MRVLLVASEVNPIAKVGGLGDVIGALPRALVSLGVEAGVVTGYYGTHEEAKYPSKVVGQLTVPWGGSELGVGVRQATLPGSLVPVYLIEQPEIIGSGGVYDSRTAMTSAQSELERFLLISKAAVRLPELIGWQPDVWHLHDWHAAAVTVFLQAPHAPTLMTIHNLANQGWALPETVNRAGLPVTVKGELNLFRLGLTRATWLSTVSPTYAQEIQSEPEGEGLQDVLKARSHELTGIVNGLDTDFFNPEADKFLVQTYDAASVASGKLANRTSLEQELKLSPEAVPLFGLVSRLTNQKGIELISEALEPYLKARQLKFVCLGVGQPELEQALQNLVQRYPGLVAGAIKFDERLAHRIYAGSDFFLMPSRFEPCGLGQLVAMRYGTVPIVRATGGLKDTVVDLTQAGGTGVVFEPYTVEALSAAVARALELYHQRATLEAVQQRGLTRDSSWVASAREYLKLYQSLCQRA